MGHPVLLFLLMLFLLKVKIPTLSQRTREGWGNLWLICLLIFRRLLDVIDDQNLGWGFLRFEF
jgi:hypothetical protein